MTLYHIESDLRRASISPIGAELRSLKNLDTQEEYIWGADPEIWSGSAPILFPIVGGLKDDRFLVDDDWYSLPKHGFARRARFAIVDQSPEAIRFELAYSDEFLKQFPWRFNLQVTFKLIKDVLHVRYAVHNLDTTTMYFNIGSHPAFTLPDIDGTSADSISDYSVEFSEIETLKRYVLVGGLLSSDVESGLSGETKIDLSPSIFDRDALIFTNIKSDAIALVHNQKGVRVKVNTGRAPHLGIWAKPGARFVCIEPWWGYSDFDSSNGLFKEKPDIQQLAPGQQFDTGIKIQTFN